jgi:hypothetical protein
MVLVRRVVKEVGLLKKGAVGVGDCNAEQQSGRPAGRQEVLGRC